MNNKARISIAMATYNGSRFLADQLASIRDQSEMPHELLIWDDASSDETLTIARKFAETVKFQVRIFENSTNAGFAESFLRVARLCSGDWVAFCDQDDFWFSDKIKLVGRIVSKYNDSDLKLVAHSAILTDENLTPTIGLQPKFTSDEIVQCNGHNGFWGLPGFSCVFRRELISDYDYKNRPRSYDGQFPVQIHDKWICFLANATGSVYYISKPLAFYRRHASAVTGYYGRLPLSAILARSRGAGSEHYTWRSLAALESAGILGRIAKTRSDRQTRRRLIRSALLFRRISRIYEERATLYRGRLIIDRIRSFLAIIRLGGYCGPRFTRLGFRAFMKDLARCVVGFGEVANEVPPGSANVSSVVERVPRDSGRLR